MAFNRPIERIDAPAADLSGLDTRYMNPGELDMLIHLIGSVKPANVLEIGTNAGRTAKAILRNVPSIQSYFGIDVPQYYVTSKLVQRNEVPMRPGHLALDNPRFRLLLTRRGSLDLTPEDLPLMDAIFIDGDHGAEAVMHDYMLAKSLIRIGGIIIFHDDNELPTVDVTQTLDKIYKEGHHITHVMNTWLAFERFT